MPAIVWYPSTSALPPMSAQQFTTGVEHAWGEGFTVSADLYYRAISNLHMFRPDSAASTDMNQIAATGTGEGSGVQVMVRKRAGGVTGSISYSYARAQAAPDGGGRLVNPFQFTRRHEVQSEIAFLPDEHWTFAGRIVMAADDMRGVFETGTMSASHRAFDYGGASNSISAIIPDLNSDRLPGYQRLELQCSYATTAGGFPLRLTLQMLSSYGIQDPFSWMLTGSTDVRDAWKARLHELPLFPLYPVFSLSMHW
jgi:hypothetical protein